MQKIEKPDVKVYAEEHNPSNLIVEITDLSQNDKLEVLNRCSKELNDFLHEKMCKDTCFLISSMVKSKISDMIQSGDLLYSYQEERFVCKSRYRL